MILDVTVGAKKIYFGWDKKLNDPLIGIDIRKETFIEKTGWEKLDGRKRKPWTMVIRPTILADMRFLPFRDSVFDTIVCDPPHDTWGLTSFMRKEYGSWTQRELVQIIRRANDEFQRVLRPRGTLILKTRPRQFPLYETLLKNFVFFLPISTYRTRGSFQDKRKQKGAMWAIGQAREVA